MALDAPTLAYVAGVIDMHGLLRVRDVHPGRAQLPSVAVYWPNFAMLEYLAELTGTKPERINRAYRRAGCNQHCAEKHQHVISRSGKWSVTGAKATILLWNVRPFMRLQVEEATSLIVLGTQANIKRPTVQKMADLGWDVPDFEILAG